jgi:hypothetical protein
MWELSPLYPGAKMLCCCVGGLETIGNHPSIDIYHLEELLSTFTYSTIQYRTVQYSVIPCYVAKITLFPFYRYTLVADFTVPTVPFIQ